MIPSVDRFGHASHVTLKEQGDRETRQRRARAAPSPASRSPTVGDLLTDFSGAVPQEEEEEQEENHTLASSQRSLQRPDTRAHNFRTAISLIGPWPLLEP